MFSVNNTSNEMKDFVDDLRENVDHVFLLTNATFVCLMQCGFACLEAGSVRSKNVTNIIMKNLMDIFISCLAYWLVGYALAYGNGNKFMGLTYWAGAGIPRYKYSHWFFQFVFAATAATIVSGAVAERCNFVAYIVYSAIISGFIYPIVSHWVWAENGWLLSMGYSDFAGSGAVHLLGGTCSLIAAVLLGPRIGRFEGTEMPGHSIPLVGIGGLILITGFLAFNGGSLGTMTTLGAGETISIVITNTVMAGTGGSGAAFIAGRIGLAGPKIWNFGLTLNGALTGMVSVCAAVNAFQLWNSFLIGLVGGFIFLGIHHMIILCKGAFLLSITDSSLPIIYIQSIHNQEYENPFVIILIVDDPLDAVAVHFGGGLWGILAGPIFRNNGIIFEPNKKNFLNLVYNITGGFAIFVWSSVTCFFLFGSLKWFDYLRVSKEEELLGLDISKHKEPAYPPAGWGNSFQFVQNKQNSTDGNARERKILGVQEHLNQSFQSDYL